MKKEVPAQKHLLKIEWPGHDLITLEYDVQTLMVSSLKVVGCAETLNILQGLVRDHKTQALSEWALPKGQSHSEMMIRELILTAQGKWDYPYKEERLCHCREVATLKVDHAILGGAHSTHRVTLETGAASACSACQVHIDKIIQYRLKVP